MRVLVVMACLAALAACSPKPAAQKPIEISSKNGVMTIDGKPTSEATFEADLKAAQDRRKAGGAK